MTIDINADIPFDPNALKAGDWITHGRELVYQEPGYRVYATRIGPDHIKITEEYDGLEELFKQNAEEAANFSRNSKLRDFQKVASVPRIIVDQWEEESGNDKEYIRSKLNDANFSKFRTNNLRL